MDNESEGFFWLLRLVLFSVKASEGMSCELVANHMRRRTHEDDVEARKLLLTAYEGRMYARLLERAAMLWMPSFKLAGGKLEYL
jgi:hypothetical protein